MPTAMQHMEDDSEYAYLNVILKREESGFGFRILGGNTDDVSIFVVFIIYLDKCFNKSMKRDFYNLQTLYKVSLPTRRFNLLV